MNGPILSNHPAFLAMVDALGLDDLMVKGFELRAFSGEVAQLAVTILVDQGQADGLVEVVREYGLTALDQAEPGTAFPQAEPAPAEAEPGRIAEEADSVEKLATAAPDLMDRVAERLGRFLGRIYIRLTRRPGGESNP